MAFILISLTAFYLLFIICASAISAAFNLLLANGVHFFVIIISKVVISLTSIKYKNQI